MKEEAAIVAEGSHHPVWLRHQLPTSMLSARVPPASRKPRLLAGQSWSPSIYQSFSGSTHYLAMAGMEAGVLEGAFGFVGRNPIANFGTNVHGAVWKARRRLQRQRPAGFKFTRAYLDRAWRKVIPALTEVDVISNFQVVAPRLLDVKGPMKTGLHFYIDGTLREYFETYSAFEAGSIDPSTIRHAVDLETMGYRAANSIVAMSQTTAETLIERYGVDPHRVHVVLPGANILDKDVPDRSLPLSASPFVLSFVGVYPVRKGVDRLIRVADLLRAEGRDVRIRIIGDAPDRVRDHPAVDFLGRIDKRINAEEFVEATASTHFGCLLSEAELTGIGLVESFRVGVPAIGSGVGGMVDILRHFGGLVAPPDMPDEALADLIRHYMDDFSAYTDLRSRIAAKKTEASWTRAALELDQALSLAGSG